ncbi:hypothetical protein D1B31_08350 [Neobacillus notoginsengisoli]|uniref:Lipoprotein n=1 Tax=Neobacillus notoginsengisoli TaxID=1578198 RepID=A0A417YWT9_9BACI|nr:hypothetical protein [Neobacillus notoginsengisoli]RHW41711.1 hypothetical protein D1B31_08350 [Neobacillus notoginsengisoli]
MKNRLLTYFAIFLLSITLYGCNKNVAASKQIFYSTKEQAIVKSFEYEGFNTDNILSIEKHSGEEIIIFLNKGIGFAFIQKNPKGYSVTFDGIFRDYKLQDRTDGVESFTSITTPTGAKIPVLVGKILNSSVREVKVTDNISNSYEVVNIKKDQVFWYYFYKGKWENKKVEYIK